MADTLTRLGDARYTDLARHGMFDIGLLARQQHAAEEVVLVGFGSHQGTVTAKALIPEISRWRCFSRTQ